MSLTNQAIFNALDVQILMKNMMKMMQEYVEKVIQQKMTSVPQNIAVENSPNGIQKSSLSAGQKTTAKMIDSLISRVEQEHTEKVEETAHNKATKVKKSYKPRVLPEHENRCCARSWNGGIGNSRCTRKRSMGDNHSVFCKQHAKKITSLNCKTTESLPGWFGIHTDDQTGIIYDRPLAHKDGTINSLERHRHSSQKRSEKDEKGQKHQKESNVYS